MLNKLIRFSLEHKVLILVCAGFFILLGGLWIPTLPVDVFPDLTAPTVTVLTEAPGMGPEEIETLVTFPLEAALNGASGVRRVRSVSAAGLSVVWVEFGWKSEIYQARQIVAERLQGVELPSHVNSPELGPVSSIMGEITFIAITSETISGMELRRLADTVIRRTLLAVPGISQVVSIGGDVEQYQVELDPTAMTHLGVTLEVLAESLSQAGVNPAAGFHVESGKEFLVRGKGRIRTAQDLEKTVIRVDNGIPLTVDSLAQVRRGAEPQRGTAAYCTRPAVILSVQKQPGANTMSLTREIEEVMKRLEPTLPEGVVVETENFRQADFIEVAIHNVSVAMRDGGILVVLILFLFLGNIRSTFIAATAIPLSVIAAILVISGFGQTINTMSLGGLTIAIGALVDDAIIGVENVVRRLRESNKTKPDGTAKDPGSSEIVFEATSEVRHAILYATMIIGLVFLPLFFLPGMEGRLLRPLGATYVIALAASLLVSVTVTPALSLLLLPGARTLERREPWLLRTLDKAYSGTLRWVLAHRPSLLLLTALVTAPVLVGAFFVGRSFLPPFNEGALSVSIVSATGITLEEGDRLGRQVESALLKFPEVVSTSRRTGRAEKDEHVQGVNASEMEVVLKTGRPKELLLEEMRRAVSMIPGVSVSFGQPISHRIDHMISGSRANLAVKIHGRDLSVLRRLSGEMVGVLSDVREVTDVSNQEQSSIPQLLIHYDRDAMARYGVSTASLSRTVEALFQGTVVGEVTNEGIVSRIVVRYPEQLRENRDELHSLPVMTETGSRIRLGDVARVQFDLGPSLVRRENVERVAILTANISSSDLIGTVEEVRQLVNDRIDLPSGYRVVYGGQFEEAARSFRNMGLLSIIVLVGIYFLLFVAFQNHRHVLIVLVNLPLALIGGLLAVTLGSGVLNIASFIGFITLFGIATRNGVLLLTRYNQLIAKEGLSLIDAVVRGSRERMAPVLMTALTAGLALLPLVIRGGEPGNEIQSPMGQVILGGLLTSTFLNLVVVPVLFSLWGKSRRSEA